MDVQRKESMTLKQIQGTCAENVFMELLCQQSKWLIQRKKVFIHEATILRDESTI